MEFAISSSIPLSVFLLGFLLPSFFTGLPSKAQAIPREEGEKGETRRQNNSTSPDPEFHEELRLAEDIVGSLTDEARFCCMLAEVGDKLLGESKDASMNQGNFVELVKFLCESNEEILQLAHLKNRLS
ncbi:hypothetical protein K1719_000328 [Acacia pycnantha]|nr:hypothetical protein K1719_000328 [Acacia pycnantha]